MGLIISFLYSFWLCVISQLPLEEVYLKSTHFLYEWYVVWTIIFASIFALIVLFIWVISGFSVKQMNTETVLPKIGIFLGIVGITSTFSAVPLIIFAVRRGLYVGSAFLLSTALIYGSAGYQWDYARLIIGGILLLITMVSRRSSSCD
ncbi:MAG: hypothetical protein WCW87_01260 [Candidatus Paceibacterota bacterium]